LKNIFFRNFRGCSVKFQLGLDFLVLFDQVIDPGLSEQMEFYPNIVCFTVRIKHEEATVSSFTLPQVQKGEFNEYISS